MPMDEMLYYRLGQKRGGGGTGGGADWNAKEGEAGYVKNRTHWVEEGLVTLLDTTVEVGEELYAQVDSCVFAIGKTYTVTLGGAVYECKAWGAANNWGYGAYIGNGAICGHEGFGEDVPFAFDSYRDMTCYFNASEQGAYSLKVEEHAEVIHPLNAKYVKDMYGEETQTLIEYPLMVPFVKDDVNSYSDCMLPMPVAPIPVFGEVYRVVWDGTEYVSNFDWIDEDVWGYVGTRKILDGEDIQDGDLPFALVYINGGWHIETNSDAASHDIGVSKPPVVHKIPEKYLPMEHIEEQIENYISNALGGKY